jgi:hypothetical protein
LVDRIDSAGRGAKNRDVSNHRDEDIKCRNGEGTMVRNKADRLLRVKRSA